MFVEAGKGRLLELIGACRASITQALCKMPPNGAKSAAAGNVTDAIDDLAGALTGGSGILLDQDGSEQAARTTGRLGRPVRRSEGQLRPSGLSCIL